MGFCQVSKWLWAVSPIQTILPTISNWQIHWVSQVCPQYPCTGPRRGQDWTQLLSRGRWASHTRDGARGSLENIFATFSTPPEVHYLPESMCFIKMNNNFLSFSSYSLALFHLMDLKRSTIPITFVYPGLCCLPPISRSNFQCRRYSLILP